MGQNTQASCPSKLHLRAKLVPVYHIPCDVLCWKALKEIKRSEGWICTGVLFASWSQLVTWDKWAEVGNDHKDTVIIAIKACWMPVGRLLLYRRRFTYSHRHCMLVFAVLECVLSFFFCFFFCNYPKLMYDTKTQFQPGQGTNILTVWGVSPIWHVTFVLKSGRH